MALMKFSSEDFHLTPSGYEDTMKIQNASQIGMDMALHIASPIASFKFL